jgi:hypothetical protein
LAIVLAERLKRVKPSPTVALTGRVARLRAEGRDIVGLGVVHLGGVSVASVEGKRVPLPTIDELIPALRLAGLLVPLFLACRHFLGLDPKKALRCGLRVSSTSLNSSAPPAPQRDATSSAASTTAPPFSLSTPPTSHVDVPDVT